MWQEAILENKKPIGKIITNPLEMGKFFKTKKMIGYEQECNEEREKPFYPFSKDPEVYEIILVCIAFNDSVRDFCHLLCMLHHRLTHLLLRIHRHFKESFDGNSHFYALMADLQYW
ncbi:uncharacterized protein MONOS_17228 [Monocercomonoides exilis]|uniref:uncharacterized protein n=1 Tax=Monocercomonoides exilis TaxID=2049356 RepID=UPI0035596D61|nr:hypothetical protein MONOS_17228 [Monocercomonoides exilis]